MFLLLKYYKKKNSTLQKNLINMKFVKALKPNVTKAQIVVK